MCSIIGYSCHGYRFPPEAARDALVRICSISGNGTGVFKNARTERRDNTASVTSMIRRGARREAIQAVQQIHRGRSRVAESEVHRSSVGWTSLPGGRPFRSAGPAKAVRRLDERQQACADESPMRKLRRTICQPALSVTVHTKLARSSTSVRARLRKAAAGFGPRPRFLLRRFRMRE
jgi:hypothetical protein